MPCSDLLATEVPWSMSVSWKLTTRGTYPSNHNLPRTIHLRLGWNDEVNVKVMIHQFVSILHCQRRAPVGSNLETLDRAEGYSLFVREGKVIRQRLYGDQGKQ